MTPKDYFSAAKSIWLNFVPKSGQANTVQGELLRAIEKLHDEAQRNGNINFNPNCHILLIAYLEKHLLQKMLFSKNTLATIKADLDRIKLENQPYLEDDIYDRINNRIVDWYHANPDGNENIKNDKLNC